MPALIPLALVASLCSSLLAAAPLGLHVGSTRDWVRYTGSRPDSVRYHLEFLDSTFKQTTSQYRASYIPAGGTVYVEEFYPRKDLVTDWKVLVTIPDSPSVRDTATLRVVGVDIDFDVFKTGSNVRIGNLAYWYKPSAHCPIDVQMNPIAEVKRYSTLVGSEPVDLLPNGTWELTLMNRSTARVGIRLSSDSTLSTISLGSGFSGSVPTVAGKEGIGLTSWLRDGSYWRLKAADGKPLPSEPGGLGHSLASGECWIYRDSTGNSLYPALTRKAYVSLELLAPTSDSAGWTRLSLRRSVHPDTSTPKDTTLDIRIDTLHRIVRIGNETGAPWLAPASMEAKWALGLMEHLILPDSAKSRYYSMTSRWEGEVPSSGTTNDWRMFLRDSIGATSISSNSRSWGVMSFQGFASWTLVAHSLDNTPLATSTAPARPVRDLAWLRTRIEQDPSLEVVRIGLDGARTSARGTAALSLLQERGVGIVQARDGEQLVRVRVARP